jgi:hypothetical protein
MTRWIPRSIVAALILLAPPAFAAAKSRDHAVVNGPLGARIDSFMVAAAD